MKIFIGPGRVLEYFIKKKSGMVLGQFFALPYPFEYRAPRRFGAADSSYLKQQFFSSNAIHYGNGWTEWFMLFRGALLETRTVFLYF